MATFTIFGLQRSGTNFLERLVTSNLKGLRLQCHWRGDHGIWKHIYNIETNDPNATAIGLKGDLKKGNMIGTEILGAYTHKHPYAWIESIARKNVDIKKTYPFVTEPSDMMLGSLNIIKLAELYKNHTSYWLNKVNQRKVYHVKYEDLIDSPERTKQVLFEIADFFKVDRPNVRNITIPNRVGMSAPFNETSREKYKNYQLETLTYDHIKAINQILNPQHLRKQGYTLITSEEEYLTRKI